MQEATVTPLPPGRTSEYDKARTTGIPFSNTGTRPGLGR